MASSSVTQTITVPVPSKRHPLQSGDRWRCSISNTSFRPPAIFQPEALVVNHTRSCLLAYSQCKLVMEGPSIPGHNKCPKNQYQHYIPRFILRQFTISRRFKKHYRRKPAQIEEYIYCYNVSGSSGKITESLISKSYGVRNLYKDVKNPENANEIELKLGHLESQAGKVISDLLATIAGDKETQTKDVSGAALSFEMTRLNHNRIRKFMHIMHYRRYDFAGTYWKEDDPENMHLRSWILKLCEQKNIEPNAGAIWLHFLRYFLDTSHPDIVAHGRKAREKISRQLCDFPHSKYAEIDPDLEHWQAVEYSDQADGLFLAIWEAAPGEEFIVSENSFGLYEGSDSSFGPTHRFHVISPRVALVLCSVGLGSNGVDPNLRGHCQRSALREATHKPPKVRYAKEPPKFVNFRERLEFEAQQNYREDDMMEFEISTLSTEHTHVVNAIILGNVKENGLITFQSKEALLRTLDSFGDNPNFKNHHQYSPLVRELLGETGGSGSFEPLRFDSNEEFELRYKKLQAIGQANPEEHARLFEECLRRVFAASDLLVAIKRIDIDPGRSLLIHVKHDPNPEFPGDPNCLTSPGSLEPTDGLKKTTPPKTRIPPTSSLRGFSPQGFAFVVVRSLVYYIFGWLI